MLECVISHSFPVSRSLILHWGNLSGEGFRHLVELPNLRSLEINHLSLTNETLAHIGKLNSLQTLKLDGNKNIRDAGLVHLYGLTNLRSLQLKETAVTEAGIKRLQAKLPECQITWDAKTKGNGPGG